MFSTYRQKGATQPDLSTKHTLVMGGEAVIKGYSGSFE